MNKVVSFILLNLVLFSANCLSQGITNEEKERIIADLDSSDYMTRYWAIDAIGRYEIIEAVPKLESIFWQQEPQLQSYILKRLLSLNSTNTYSIAKAFLDSIPNYNYEKTMITPLDLQVIATYLLFNYADYSTVDYVFQIIERDKPKNQIDPLAKSLLPKIIENLPIYAEQAKQELIYLVNNQNTRYSDRTLSLLYLSNIYGQEILPLIETSFTSDQDPIVRSSALELLFENNDPGLNQLIKDRLLTDPEPTLRYKFATTLLDSFGTPSDYRAVLEYHAEETNEVNKTLLYYDLNTFKPPKLDTLISITTVLDTLFSYSNQCFYYAWLGDLTFSNELKSILTTAKANLQNGDSLACAVQVKAFQDLVDNVYKDSLNTDPRFVTIEGWKFLYWNAQYILDRLPEIPITLPPDIQVINPAMSLVNPGAFTMAVKGTGFTTNSVVYFNGNARATTFVSDSVLNTQILSTDVSVAGNFPVWVSDGATNSDTLIYKVVSTLPQPVRPVLECVKNNGDGTYTAFFGYKNDNNVSVYIPVGNKNKFTPTPQDRGQPRVFEPGRHYKVFTVNFNGSNLVWTLNGRTSTASSNSEPCN
uniref:IPT/TIG domain-containing protein n=1 Tax=Ignavibacterium album TaxID=591197 RepID=A0A832G1G7_9BACT